MITKFKFYEAVNQGEPEVGDYIIANIDDFGGNIEKIINNNIGILTIAGKNNDIKILIIC